MHAAAHQVVHEVIVVRDRRKHSFHEAGLLLGGDGPVAEVGRGAARAARLACRGDDAARGLTHQHGD